jgi:hypothetical protein
VDLSSEERGAFSGRAGEAYESSGFCRSSSRLFWQMAANCELQPIGTQLGFNVATGQINDWMVPGTGLEPARLAALDPKSSASANSAIPATWYK